MYRGSQYVKASRNLRTIWVYTNILARYMSPDKFKLLDTDRFSLEFVELEYLCDSGLQLNLILDAIARVAKMVGCPEQAVFMSLAKTPKAPVDMITDYLGELANEGMRSLSLRRDALSGLDDQTKLIFQCLIMVLLDN